MATTDNDLTGTRKMPTPNRPPQTDQGSSSVGAMEGSAPAPDSIAPVAQFGADGTKLFNQAGQISSQGFPAQPVLEPGVNDPGDAQANVSGNPIGQSGGFPTTGSRAPITGSGLPDRSKNLNKLRGRK